MDIFDVYKQMERNDILLAFKGEVTSDLLSSVFQIMETKMDNLNENPKLKRKVYHILVEILQNLYHHLDEISEQDGDINKSAIFTVGKKDSDYFRIPKVLDK